MIRLVIADDQALVRDGFCSILNREPDIEVVAEAADGAQAVAAVTRTRPDVALLDVRMPVMDGLQAGRRILAAPAAPRVLMLTTFDADEYVYEALRGGASGFLLKDIRSGQLVEAVRTVAAGQSLLSPTVTRKLIERFILAAPATPAPAQQPRELGELTPREREVLLLIADGGPPLPWTVTTLGSLGTGGTPMVTKYQKFGDGYKAEAVKLYRESNQTIAETARNLGLKESTLANWVKKDKDNEAVAVGEAPLTPAERTRIRELEADVRRLNMENAFLKKASAYFASQNL